MNRLRPFAFLIGLALVAYIVSTLNFMAAWDRLKQLNPGLFFVAILAGTPEILFKALRLKTFVVKAKSHISVRHSLLAYLSGQPLAAVTPGKLGDVTRIVLLSRFGKISMPTALAVHAADRIYDLASIVLLAVIGLVSYITAFAQAGSALATFIGILCGMLVILALLNPRWMKFVLKPLVTGLLSKKLAERLSHHGKEFYAGLHSLLIPSFKIFGPFVLSFLAWETAIIRSYLIAMALGLPLSYLKFVLLAPVMVVVELLPISILGFGPREAALFMLFTTNNLHHEDLVVFSVLTTIAGPVFTALLGVPAAAQMIPQESRSHETT